MPTLDCPPIATLRATFQQHILDPERLSQVRTQIARHIEDLSHNGDDLRHDAADLTIPQHITGVRKRYLLARHRNAVARRNYEKLRTELTPDVNSYGAPRSQPGTLSDHIELIRLQSKDRAYQTLSRGLSRIEEVDERDRGNQPNLTPACIQLAFKAVDSDTTSDSNIHNKLEEAILEAENKLAYGRQRLEGLGHSRSTPQTSSSETKLLALLAAKKELMRWIETSLAECDSALGTDHSIEEEEDAEYQQAIRKLYEDYLTSRKSIIKAASILVKPVIATPKVQAPSDVSNTALNDDIPTVSMISPYLDSHQLPLDMQLKSVATFHNCIREISQRGQQDLHEQLLRLSDESQLLSTYPFISNSNPSTPDELLRAWNFAISAAKTSALDASARRITSGEQALDEISAWLSSEANIANAWAKLENT